MEKPGVFIHFPEKKVDVIIEGCRRLMKTIDGNNYSIAGIKPDTVYEGFRVFFNDYSIVAFFLKQKYLPTDGFKASIHPLKTVLVVSDMIPDSEVCFKEELRAQLEKLQLKPILEICPKPISFNFPDIPSCGDWLIEIDIPEIEGLDVFRNVGLPNNMTLTFSCGNESSIQKKKVSHLCCLCHDCDHSRERCPDLENFFTMKDSEINSPESIDSFCFSNWEIRDRSTENVAAPSTSKSAKQHRIEAIASSLEKKKQKDISVGKARLMKKEIKREFENEESSNSLTLKHSFNADSGNAPSKRRKTTPRVETQSESCIKSDEILAATSTTGRDSPVILYETDPKNSSTPPRPSRNSTGLADKEGLNEDNSMTSCSSNVPTSSQPETSFEPTREDLISQRDNSYFSDSNDSVRSPKPRKKPTYVPVVLPSRIKEIVLNRGRKEGELDVGQLEAFFNHVKKKMSPAKIARQFTPDVQSLKEQLKSIVQQFYMTPKAGSGEDSRFMKWLEGMLDRFDSIPGKRKKLKSEPLD